MTVYISVALRQLVSDRAQEKCEYCRIHQDFSLYSHEVDHAVALGMMIGIIEKQS